MVFFSRSFATIKYGLSCGLFVDFKAVTFTDCQEKGAIMMANDFPTFIKDFAFFWFNIMRKEFFYIDFADKT